MLENLKKTKQQQPVIKPRSQGPLLLDVDPGNEVAGHFVFAFD